MLILVSGVCGFVGSSIAIGLRKHKHGWKIVGFDNFSRPGSFSNKAILEDLGVEVHYADARQASDVSLLPAADWIIDAAANASVLAGVDGKSNSRQLLENNLWGTVNLLEHAKNNQSGFILLSTSRVYSIDALANLKLSIKNGAFVLADNQEFSPGLSAKGISEEFPTSAPISLYGSTKLASEILALEYGNTFDYPVWINRCSVLAGAGQFGRSDQGIFAYWVNAYLRKEPLKYIGFGGLGHQVRDCLHPRDLIALLTAQMRDQRKNIPRTYNLGGGTMNATSLKQLSDWCAQQFGPHKIGSNKAGRAFDVPWLVFDSSLAQKYWQWQPSTPASDIFAEIAEHAKANADWLNMTSS
jgi:CDP-paratose 2-epimerase